MRTARCLGPLLMLAVLPAFQGTDRPNAARPDRDPPGRVGRLSFVTGAVSFRPGDVDDWTEATVNYPLHNGDHLWTDSDARAEITVGSTAFRLAPLSAFGFLALDDRTAQVRLSQGSLNVRVRDLGDDESLEIDTPSGAVSLRPLGLGRAVGLDVDRRRALGLCAVPLRPLGLRGRGLGLGAGPRGGATGVRAGPGGVRRRQKLEPGDRRRQRCGVVPART